MGFGLSMIGAAAGYKGYKDELREQEDAERRRVEDQARKNERAYQDELRSRQRYEWKEADRVRDDNKASMAEYVAKHPLWTGDEDPAAGAPDAPAAPAADGGMKDGGVTTYPVPDPADGIAPERFKAASSAAAPLDAALDGPPTQRALAQDLSPAAATAPATAQQAPSAPAGGAAPAGLPKPRVYGNALDMQRYALEAAARKGDVNPQMYAQTRGFLDKMRAEGVTQAIEAFARGDYQGGIDAYNKNGIMNGARLVGTPQDGTTTLPDGTKMPTKLVTVALPEGRMVIDTTLDRYKTLGLEKQLDLMSKGADRDYKNKMADAAKLNADTNAGYRKDQADNMREARRLEAMKIAAKGSAADEKAANWTDKADAYLVDANKIKDADGNETYDGEGLTFAKTVGIDYSRKHGGDAMSGAGYATSVNNRIRSAAASIVAQNPKLNLQGEISRLRGEYLKHVTRAAPAQQQGGAPTADQASFSKTYGAAAERAGKALGVDPKVLLGQWGLETGWGQSIIPGTHNLGNIKDFSGSGVAATDNMNGSVDNYRAFENPEAFADHYVGLIQRKYPNAVGAGADAARFGAALKAGGYAEDPDYAAKLVASYRAMAGAGTPAAAQPQAKPAAAAPKAAPQPAQLDDNALVEGWVNAKLIGTFDGPDKYLELSRTHPNEAVRKAAARLYARAQAQAQASNGEPAYSAAL